MASPFARRVLQRWAAAAAVVTLTAAPAPPALQAAAATTRPVVPPLVSEPQQFKTRADARALAPLGEALFAYDAILKRSSGKAPADAARRLDEMARLSVQAKADIRDFVSALREAKETEAFEKAVYAAAETSGRPTLVAEIRGQGGPVAVLAQADRLIDGLIAERRHGAASRESLDGVLELLGLTVTVHASVLSTACGFFWFTISLGYATTHAYTSCYDGTL